jgi:hypothetical protein
MLSLVAVRVCSAWKLGDRLRCTDAPHLRAAKSSAPPLIRPLRTDGPATAQADPGMSDGNDRRIRH